MRRLLKKLKVLNKKKLFKKNATCGKKLGLSTRSYCSSPSKDRIVIGDNCDLPDCRLMAIGNGKIEIGDYSTVRYSSQITSTCGIKIGNYVIISNNVHISDNNSHPTDPQTRIEMCKTGFYGEAWSQTRSDSKPVVIEDNVWIGERSTILKGVHIGKGSIVASNSVVTKDVPPYTIVAGNPAKVVKHIEGYEE